MLRLSIAGTFTFCLVGAVACFAPSTQPISDSTRPVTTESRSNSSAAPAHISESRQHSKPQIISGVTFFESSSLSRSWTVHPSRRSITFTTAEVMPNGVAVESESTRSTSFEVIEVAPRSAIDLFIAGVAPRGGFLIERWSLNDVVGALSSTIASTGLPMGVPTSYSSSQMSVFVVGGGFQLETSERTTTLPPRRELFAQDSEADFAAFGADPEGRFILVLTESGELRQYLTDAPPDTFSVVADASTHPFLPNGSGLMLRAQHSIHGRIWLVHWWTQSMISNVPVPPADWETIVMFDIDNDGDFELITSLHPTDPFLDELTNVNLWSSDFASF